MVPARLTQLVVCPICHAKLRINEDFTKLRCIQCGKRYRITDGIPVLLPGAAEETLNFPAGLSDL